MTAPASPCRDRARPGPGCAHGAALGLAGLVLAAAALFGAAGAGAAEALLAASPPPGEAARLRTLRERGWACLDAGDAEGALNAAAQMLRLVRGHGDALVLEEHAQRARLSAPGRAGDLPSRRDGAGGLLADVERESRPLLGGLGRRAEPTANDAEAADARARLDQDVAVEFRDTPLPEAVGRLAELSGLSIVLDRAAARAATTRVTLQSPGMPVEAVLRWIERLSGLRHTVRGRTVLLAPPGTRPGEAVRREYDVSSFLSPPTRGTASASPPDPGGMGDGWVRYLRATVAPGTWEQPGQEAVLQERSQNTIAYRGGRLVVVHTPEVQDQVADLLDMFRRERNLQVHMICRFLILNEAYLDSMRLELSYDSLTRNGTAKSRTIFSTAFDTGVGSLARFSTVTTSGGLSVTVRILGDHAVSAILRTVLKERRGLQLTAPRLTCLNTQRANFQSLINHNYVSRVTGDEGTEIGNVPEGIIFDVQPFVSADRRYITLVLQPQLRTLVSLENYQFYSRILPDQIDPTTGNPIQQNQFIQIPTVTLRSVATTVIVPNGGTLLVGGLAEAEENRGVASVPFLSDLPAVGHLLRGWDRSEGRRTLVILVTAQIVPDVFER